MWLHNSSVLAAFPPRSTCCAKFAREKFSGWEGGGSCLGASTMKENSRSCSSALKSFWSFLNKWKDKEEMFRPPRRVKPVSVVAAAKSFRSSATLLLLVFDAARDQWIATNSFLFLHLSAVHKGSRMRVCVCLCDSAQMWVPSCYGKPPRPNNNVPKLLNMAWNDFIAFLH